MNSFSTRFRYSLPLLWLLKSLRWLSQSVVSIYARTHHHFEATRKGRRIPLKKNQNDLAVLKESNDEVAEIFKN